MYEVFYNLKAEPFRLSPDHRFCYEHKGYARARAYMAYAFMRAEGFVMITGRPGTGKTTLIGELVESLARDNVSTANLVCTQLDADDLLRTVAYNFGISAAGADKAELLQRLEVLFNRWHREHRRALLIVDEAQDLSASAMEELRLLTNIQLNGQPLLQIFLLGQPELRELILAPAMEQVHQRIVAACHLEGLNVDEVETYVMHRLKKVGWTGDPSISKAVFPLLHKYSEGIPRRINLICSRLFLHGGVEERHSIDTEDLRVVLDELQSESLAAGTTISQDDFAVEEQTDWVNAPEQVAKERSVAGVRLRAVKDTSAEEPPEKPDPGAKKKSDPGAVTTRVALAPEAVEASEAPAEEQSTTLGSAAAEEVLPKSLEPDPFPDSPDPDDAMPPQEESAAETEQRSAVVESSTARAQALAAAQSRDQAMAAETGAAQQRSSNVARAGNQGRAVFEARSLRKSPSSAGASGAGRPRTRPVPRRRRTAGVPLLFVVLGIVLAVGTATLLLPVIGQQVPGWVSGLKGVPGNDAEVATPRPVSSLDAKAQLDVEQPVLTRDRPRLQDSPEVLLAPEVLAADSPNTELEAQPDDTGNADVPVSSAAPVSSTIELRDGEPAVPAGQAEGGSPLQDESPLPEAAQEPSRQEPSKVFDAAPSAISSQGAAADSANVSYAEADSPTAASGDLTLLVGFAFDSVALGEGALEVLNEAARVLNNHLGSSAEITGFADRSGDAVYNLDLSWDRARVVEEYLVAAGIDRSRLAVQGRGAVSETTSGDPGSAAQDKERFRIVQVKIYRPGDP